MIPVSISLPSTFPLMFPKTPIIHSLLVVIVTHTIHTYNTYMFTLLSPFSIALMYIYLFKAKRSGFGKPWRSSSMGEANSPALISRWLPVALHVGVGTWRISPAQVDMPTGVFNVLVTTLLRISGFLLPTTPRRHYLATDLLGLLFLRHFDPLFPSVPQILGVGVVVQV